MCQLYMELPASLKTLIFEECKFLQNLEIEPDAYQDICKQSSYHTVISI